LKEVFTSMEELVRRAKSDERKSLATLKPREITDFVIEPTEREWKPQWRNHLLQLNLFDRDEKGEGKVRRVLPKLPYKYFYRFLAEGDHKPRQLMIEDWELGALYWRSYYRHGRDEQEANRLVKQKFFYDFCSKNELYFFLGTSLQYHLVSSQPFMIIGVFYPLKPKLPFEEKHKPSTLDTNGIIQPRLFEA